MYGPQRIFSQGREIQIKEENPSQPIKYGESQREGGLNAFIPNFLFGDPQKCTYCGESAQCIDHVIPISSYSMTRKERERTGIRTFSCTTCNATLGAKVFDTFDERVRHLNKKAIAKAQKFKSDASWTDEEIAQLDHTLRTFVANKQMAMRQADSRVAWAYSRQFYKAIEGLKSWTCIDPQHPSYIAWAANYFTGYAA